MRRAVLVCLLLVGASGLTSVPARPAPLVASPVPAFVTAAAGHDRAFASVSATSARGARWGDAPVRVCLYASGRTTWHRKPAVFTESGCRKPATGAAFGFDPVTWDAFARATLPTEWTIARATPGHEPEAVTVASGRGHAVVDLAFSNASLPCDVPVDLLFFVIPFPDLSLTTARCADVAGSVRLSVVRLRLAFGNGPLIDPQHRVLPLLADNPPMVGVTRG